MYRLERLEGFVTLEKFVIQAVLGGGGVALTSQHFIEAHLRRERGSPWVDMDHGDFLERAKI